MSLIAPTTQRAATPRARTLLDIFDTTVARCAARVAVDAADATLTYAELSEAAVLPRQTRWHGAPVVAV